jgi:uncharacterized membrane protein
MIGCFIVGGLAIAALARLARHHHARGMGMGMGCGGRWRHRRWHHRHWHPSFGFGGGVADGAEHEWLGGDPWGHGHGHGHGPYGEPEADGWDDLADSAPKLFVLRGVLRHLETTPTQERALRDATKEMKQSARALKDEARRSRADIASSMRRSSVDEVALGEMFARHDGALESLRKAFVGWTIKVHEILDDTQRGRLADLVERGPRWFGRAARRAW